MMYVFGNRGIVAINDSPNESVQITDCPDVLYRYMSRPYDQCMLDGELLIRDLDFYRSIEDATRRDTHEGRKVHHIPEGHLGSLPMRGIGYDHPVIASDNEEVAEPPPSYCLCFSRVASRELAKGKGNDTNATCVRIECPEDFIREVDRAFRDVSKRAGSPVVRSFAGLIVYKRGDQTHWPFTAGTVDPRLIKSFDRYACEAEFRILWSVSGGQCLQDRQVQLASSEKFLSIIPWNNLSPRVKCEVPCIEDEPCV